MIIIMNLKIYMITVKIICVNFYRYNETDYGKIEFGVLDIDNNMILISFRK